ncbi:MAG: hypothetical protein IPN22_14245 [Bacteroidetes bacterium]|nr:hypothetical protein [Bacteroidota bacterium]
MVFSEILKELAHWQFQYGPLPAKRKLALIQLADALPISKAEEAIALHDRLLCLLAYADQAQVYEAADKALKNLAAKIKAFSEEAGATAQWKLTESAIAHSAINSTFSYELSRWLVYTFPNQITFSGCWASKDMITRVFSQVMPAAVSDSLFDNHEYTLEQLAKKACGPQAPVDVLHWTLAQFEASAIPNKSKEQLFEMLDIYITWHTDAESPTKTFGRCSKGKKFYFQKTPLVHHAQRAKVFAHKTLKPIPLLPSEKKQLCDVAKGVLCSHYREIDPITYADEQETELYDMGRGITIALYYLLPGWRLPCESYVSYMAFRNGVPLSYGGGWLFLERAKLAGNVFPAFRGGESGLLFAQLYRLYHLRFGATCFQVDPYQIGQKNEDAIRSGAFWFYHRLGFRPDDNVLMQLAQKEDNLRKADKKYRSSAAVLRQFAQAEMLLNLSGNVHLSHKQVVEMMNLLVAKSHQGNYASYFAVSIQAFAKACKKHSLVLPKDLQQNHLAAHLCGLVFVFSDFAAWSKIDLKHLVAAMHEKTVGSERRFLESWSKIKQVRTDLRKMA